MQKERGDQDDSSTSINAFGGLGDKISSIFGKSRSFGSFFGSNRPLPKQTPPEDLQQASKCNEPIIEELDTDDDDDEVEKNGKRDLRENRQETRSSPWANRNPLVEHPDDPADEHKKINNNNMRKNFSFGNIEGTRSVSYRRVTYGGINGAYLTATTTRQTGSDGRVWEETKHADTTTGEATHRISRGINDKGHSLTRKLKSDGKVDTMETLHNLVEDDLAGFDRDWILNADRRMPGWNDGLDFPPDAIWKHNAQNAGSSSNWLTNWDSPFTVGCGGLRSDLDFMAPSSRGRPKKIASINIE